MDVRTFCSSRRIYRLGVVLLLTCGTLVIQSCKSDETKQAPVATTAPAQGAAGAVAPAPVVTQASWAPGALEELLAPVALYPDPLIAQILAASINSQEVLDGGNWLLQNQNLTGKALDAAAEKVGFGPAMRALMQFPTVVDMMCQQIDWTRQVGSAFNSDQKSVVDAVQRLRMQAVDVGNLTSTPQQTVLTKSEGGDVYVEVKPADPQIIYVPQYDPQAVYTEPSPEAAATTEAGLTTEPPSTTEAASTTTTTTTTATEDDGSGKALAAGLIGFGVGMIVGNSMQDDYYYPQWGAGVYYGGRPFYPPAYAYRPVYGGAYRPAVGYASPAGYRYNYNNVRANNNVVVNNKNYYNRFDNNQNLRAGGSRSPIASTRPATAGNWKGQSTYAGARNRGNETRLAGNTRDARPNTRDVRSPNTREVRPSPSTREARSSPGTREARPSPASREARSQTPRQSAAVSDRSPNRAPDSAARVDRGYENRARASTRQGSTEGLARPTPKRESAFSSGQAGNSGGFERSASARGNASAGSRQTSSRPASGRSGRR